MAGYRGEGFKWAAYVQRHFDIEPVDEEGTARVTLFFTQADFDNFNSLVEEERVLTHRSGGR